MAVKYSSYSMIKRLLALTMLIAFFSVCVISRLFYLQVIGNTAIVKRGLTEWLRDLPLIATRGSITDRNGVVLLKSHLLHLKMVEFKSQLSLARKQCRIVRLNWRL